MADILYTPNREQVLTSNAWAFLHWLRTARGIDLPDWAALQRFSANQPADFRSAVAAFARLPEEPVRLARHAGPQESLVLRRADGARVVLCRDDLLDSHPNPLPQAGEGAGPHSLHQDPLSRLRERVGVRGLPAAVSATLARLWPPALLIRPLADLLLHADLRPDDRLCVVGSAAWPWLAALLEGATVILAATTHAALLATVADEHATILVAPAQALAEAAFQRARRRPDLASLRTIIATGGPLSPEGRTRIYTWIKSDLMLLARTGDTLWGNPLEPVYARPVATPGFLTPPPSTPATR
jgi:hypothetical protein